MTKSLIRIFPSFGDLLKTLLPPEGREDNEKRPRAGLSFCLREAKKKMALGATKIGLSLFHLSWHD